MDNRWPPEPESVWWNWWQAALDVVVCFVAPVFPFLFFMFLTGASFEAPAGSAEYMVLDAAAWLGYCASFVLLALIARRRKISTGALWTGLPSISSQAWLHLLLLGGIWYYLTDDFLARYFAAQYRAESESWLANFKTSVWPLAAFAAIIVAPLGEELVFRRVLLRAWSQGWLGFWGGAALSSALWATIHLYAAPFGVILFLEGLILCWLARRVQSIWPGIALHFVNNIVAVAMALISA